MTTLSLLHSTELLRALRAHTTCEVRLDLASRRLYSTDASIYQVEPQGVVLPRTTADLIAAVQIALEMRIPLVPRGGGTSLSGQSIGPGLIVDCSKYLNTVLDVDIQGRRARVQPGVVLDALNRQLADHGLMFGPEVATASRACLSGMIGNNSAGSRSLVYGKTGDHVLSLDALLSDGHIAKLGPAEGLAWAKREDEPTLAGRLHRDVRQIVNRNADEIRRRFPNILRRVSGYNLEALLPPELRERPVTPEWLAAYADHGPGTRQRGLHHLLVGGEGTLGFVTEAELHLVPRPKHRGLLVPHFVSLDAALDCLELCLRARPSAVELVDAMLIQLARQNLALRETVELLYGTPAALFMVEFCANNAAEVSSQVYDLQRKLLCQPGVTAALPALDAKQRDPLWNFRSAAVPLLYGLPGDRKPATFVEDTAVAPARLPEFAARFREVLARHGTEGAFYGHASVGCLHIRPVLDLKRADDVARMRLIMEDISDLVLTFGGSLSGEHGDGLVRSEWNRKMFGPQVYSAFQSVKRAFDPANLFNPGKVVDAPPMTDHLRETPATSPPTVFDYSVQQGFARSIELCNGAGVCRKTQGGTMCPSYRATRDEADTTRGRANALRTALSQPADRRRPPLAERWVFDVMDLCLSCKACKAECPSNVDLAKLKAEFLQAYYRTHRRPLGHHLMASIHLAHRYGVWLGPLVHKLGQTRAARWLLERLAGVDARRSLPEVHADHFRRWFAGHTPADGVGHAGDVLLLDDCFTTYHEPQIGRAAVELLERLGYRVQLTGLECCGRAMTSKGFVQNARDLVRRQVGRLARRVGEGVPVLGLEPSCVAMLADEWPELAPGDAARRVAAASQPIEAWLAKQGIQLPLSRTPGKLLVHAHCHQKALFGASGAAAALEGLPGAEVKLLDAGCCGMAGSFGYEAEHYDLSVQIAGLQLLPALKAEPDAIVVATGTSCRHQIRDLDGREALHPVEILHRAVMESLPSVSTH